MTNAILHGRAPAGASGLRRRSWPGVEVHDHDPSTPPVLRHDYDLTEPGGRGLQLVDTLADRWGWAENDGGKVVWFELDA